MLSGFAGVLCAVALYVAVSHDTQENDEPRGPRIAEIHVTPVRPKLVVGGAQGLTATGTFSDGSKRDVTAEVAWRSSASGVATVNDEGEVVARGVGRR
jgi:hypothetical protein